MVKRDTVSAFLTDLFQIAIGRVVFMNLGLKGYKKCENSYVVNGGSLCIATEAKFKNLFLRAKYWS